jgi:hypothetical protein
MEGSGQPLQGRPERKAAHYPAWAAMAYGLGERWFSGMMRQGGTASQTRRLKVKAG